MRLAPAVHYIELHKGRETCLVQIKFIVLFVKFPETVALCLGKEQDRTPR